MSKSINKYETIQEKYQQLYRDHANKYNEISKQHYAYRSQTFEFRGTTLVGIVLIPLMLALFVFVGIVATHQDFPPYIIPGVIFGIILIGAIIVEPIMHMLLKKKYLVEYRRTTGQGVVQKLRNYVDLEAEMGIQEAWLGVCKEIGEEAVKKGNVVKSLSDDFSISPKEHKISDELLEKEKEIEKKFEEKVREWYIFKHFEPLFRGRWFPYCMFGGLYGMVFSFISMIPYIPRGDSGPQSVAERFNMAPEFLMLMFFIPMIIGVFVPIIYRKIRIMQARPIIDKFNKKYGKSLKFNQRGYDIEQQYSEEIAQVRAELVSTKLLIEGV